MYKERRPLATVQYEQHILLESEKMERKKYAKILQVREKLRMDSSPLKLLAFVSQSC